MTNGAAHERDCSRPVVRKLALGALRIVVSGVVRQTSDGNTHLHALMGSCSY